MYSAGRGPATLLTYDADASLYPGVTQEVKKSFEQCIFEIKRAKVQHGREGTETALGRRTSNAEPIHVQQGVSHAQELIRRMIQLFLISMWKQFGKVVF